MTQIASSTPTYDANGNVTNDFLNSYSWDSDARPTTIDGITVTYDALGRVAEEDKSGTFTQFVYSPTGQEFALMNGQTLSKAYVPLPGGELPHTILPDCTIIIIWIGWAFSMASSTTRTVLYDAAYAPFGVTYAQTGTGTAAFAGMTLDTTATLYDFPAREYGYQGRWPSPDPAGMTAVDPSNPQTWNRYAYVLNSPLMYVDPSGMNHCAPNATGRGPTSGPCSGGISSSPMPGEYPVSFYYGGTNLTGVTYSGDSGVSVIGTTFTNVGGLPQGTTAPIFGAPSVGYSNPFGVSTLNSFGIGGVGGGGSGGGDPANNGDALSCQAGFIAASNQAWMRAGDGFSNTESGFWVTGSATSPTYTPLPSTNQPGTITGLTVPSNAIALVHTHPNSSIPQPSPGDINNSNASNLPFYVLSSRGLWLYQPHAKSSTMLRPGTSWQKPCSPSK